MIYKKRTLLFFSSLILLVVIIFFYYSNNMSKGSSQELIADSTLHSSQNTNYSSKPHSPKALESTKEISLPSDTIVENTITTVIRNPPPKLSLDGQFIDHYDTLIQQFNNGDMEAGLILAHNLYECLNIPTSEVARDKMLLNHSHSSENDINSNLNEKILNMYEFCLGISTKQRREYFDYLLISAESGYVPAQTSFFYITKSALLGKEFESLPKVEQKIQLDEIKKIESAFIHKAAEGGSLVALSILASQYEKTNKTISLSYANVLLEFVDNNNI
jgi:hypothetical protein